MKIIIDENSKQYKANLHSHSNCSDGAFSPSELKEMYMNEGYSILAFSDHEHLLNHSYLSDDKFTALTASEIAIKEFSDKSTLDKLDMKVCHLNFIAKKPDNLLNLCYSDVYDHFSKPEVRKNIIHNGIYDRVYSSEKISEIISLANKNGFLVQYNHPLWSLENYNDYKGYKGLWAGEIFNTSCQMQGLDSYCPFVYDDLLRYGNKIFATMNDDNHNKYRYSDSFGGFNMIMSKSLLYSDIISALEKGEFYSSTGAYINSLVYKDGNLYVKADNARSISLQTDSRRSDKVLGNSAVFPISQNDLYVRLKIVDNNNNVAHTNAYFISDLLNQEEL